MWFNKKEYTAKDYQHHKSYKKNVPIINNCKICKEDYITDLSCKYATEDYNYYYHNCDAHFYKDRWWTKKEWDEYVNDISENI